MKPAYQQTVEEVVRAFGADAVRGLTSIDARVRLARHGSNRLAAERPVPRWRKFLGQFHDVLVILRGGLVDGTGSVRHAQTMAFTTLMLFQLFNLFNARSDRHSALVGLFRNGWLWGAIALSLALQVAVVYAPFLQRAFATEALTGADWLRSTAVASAALWVRELQKLFGRRADYLRSDPRPV
jgi:magnesium-transporting ATPase (P-type)